MEDIVRIIKNIAFYLLGIVLCIGGYKIYNDHVSDNEALQGGNATTIESEGAEESSGSL